MNNYYAASSFKTENEKFPKPPQKKKSGEVPWRFSDAKLFSGYGRQQVHPKFLTTSSVYGSQPPNICTMPDKYFGFNSEFSNSRVLSGNYKNNSLNIK